MSRFIINFAIAVYCTSTIFMLSFYFNVKRKFAKNGQKFRMPWFVFVWMHFVPIVHTIELIKIELRAKEIKKERGV